MPVVDLKSLIADARLILEYAVRAGKLPNDALAKSIQRLENSESARDIIALQNAMNEVVTAVAPMTLVDLRAGRNPFDQRNIDARSRWQVGLALGTLWLIVVIAYYQYLVQRQEAALRAFKDVVEARASEKITDARNLAQVGNALTKDSCQRDAYQKARHDLRQLAGRTVMASTTLFELSKASAWPMVDTALALTHWLSTATSAVKEPRSEIEPPGALSSQQQPAPPADQIIEDLCDENQRPRVVPAGYPVWLRNVVLDTIDEFCFASKLSVDQLAVDPIRRGSSYFGPGLDPQNPVAKVEQRMRVQVGWLLPFLYGLLGACVYVMRRLLFDTKAAVVENVVIVLRLALGALAGVAIGWFAVPNGGTAALVSVSSLPYALAFLAGFSIDILFTLLDRFNRLLIDKTLPAPQS